MGRIRVGEPDTTVDTPTHVRGMHEGNQGPHSKQRGHHPERTADARRATGINWKQHNAILDVMPNISPS